MAIKISVDSPGDQLWQGTTCGVTGIIHVCIVLPDVLDYTLWHYRVWHSVRLMKMSSKVGVCKYLTEYYFPQLSSCPRVLSRFAGCFFIVCLDPSLAKDGC